MQRGFYTGFIILFWLLLVLLAAHAASVVYGQEFQRVKRVIDGDTIELESGERVRLLGVNTPETKHPTKTVEQFGKEAAAFTKRMLEGKQVRIELDPVASQKDKYSRTLAYVFLQDGTHLNAEIIRQGYGFATLGRPPLKHQEEFRQLETEARDQRRGLWAKGESNDVPQSGIR